MSVGQEPLRACPTCRTPVAQANLGMRDYSHWLQGVLPGKVSGSDIDFVLDQASTGRMLMLEFKEQNKRLGTGQRLLLQALFKRNIDVWLVHEYDDDKDGVIDHVVVGSMDETGQVRFSEKMTGTQLALKVKSWWYDGMTP